MPRRSILSAADRDNLLAMPDVQDELIRHYTQDILPFSGESIVPLIGQHLACKNASRLPVLIVAAAYQSTNHQLGEMFLPQLVLAESDSAVSQSLKEAFLALRQAVEADV